MTRCVFMLLYLNYERDRKKVSLLQKKIITTVIRMCILVKLVRCFTSDLFLNILTLLSYKITKIFYVLSLALPPDNLNSLNVPFIKAQKGL